MSLRSLMNIAAPGLLLLLPLGIWLRLSPESPWLAEAGRGYPLIVLGAAILLAWRFRRSRAAAAAIVLALVPLLARLRVDGPAAALGDGPAAEALARIANGLGAAGGASGTAVGGTAVLEVLAASVLAPLFALLAFSADRRLGAPRALAQMAAAPALAAGTVLFLLAGAPGRLETDPSAGNDASMLARILERNFVDPALSAWTGLPQVVLAGALGGLLLLAALALYRRRALDGALFWAALAGLLAVTSAGTPASGVWILAGALSLCFGLVEASHALAFRDELTDLPGRRSLNDLLGSLRPPATVAIVDIDRFKTFNDRHGHDVGDQVLRKVAAELASVTGGGRAFRSGGEEFTIVFPGRGQEEALPHLEALRRTIAERKFTMRSPVRPAGAKGAKKRGKGRRRARRLSVTVSIGAASLGPGHRNVEDVVKAADGAMYRAKQKGRNRVVA